MRLSFGSTLGLPPSLAIGRSSPIAVARTATHSAAACRFAGVDAMRLAATAAVVWYHTFRSAELARISSLAHFATPLFAVVAGYFLIASVRKGLQSIGRGVESPSVPGVVAGYLHKRVLRLYLPFLGWTAIYLLLAQTPLRPGSIDAPTLDFRWLFVPVEGHLWFLPFVMALTLVFAPVVAWALSGSRRREVVFSAALGAAAVGVAAMPLEWLRGTPWYVQSMHTRTPSFIVGLSLGLLGAGAFRLPTTLSRRGYAAVLFTLFTATVACWSSGWVVAAVNLAGLSALAVGVCPAWGLLRGGRTSDLASLSVGVYLSHMVIRNMVHAAMDSAEIAPTITGDVAAFAVVLSASLAIAVLLRRCVFTRWLVP